MVVYLQVSGLCMLSTILYNVIIAVLIMIIYNHWSQALLLHFHKNILRWLSSPSKEVTKFQLEEIFQVSRCTTNGLNWDHAQVVEWTRILSYLRHRAGPIILNDAQNFVTTALYYLQSTVVWVKFQLMAILLVSLRYLLMSCSFIPIEALNITIHFLSEWHPWHVFFL